MVEPMYLCVAPEYQRTGVGRALMDMATQHCMDRGQSDGIFLANRMVAKPVACFRQYSRPLDYKRLRANDFVAIQGIDDTQVHNRTRVVLKPNSRYVVAEKTEANIALVHRMYCQYMETFCLHVVLTPQDIENYMFDSRYARTVLVYEKNQPVDFVTYNFYDLENTNKESDNLIRVANVLMYSSNNVRVDLLFMNILKQIAMDRFDMLYVTDMMHSNEIILSNVRPSDYETDPEEENASYDMQIIKTSKKLFVTAYGWGCEPMTQNMASWLVF